MKVYRVCSLAQRACEKRVTHAYIPSGNRKGNMRKRKKEKKKKKRERERKIYVFSTTRKVKVLRDLPVVRECSGSEIKTLESSWEKDAGL